MMKAYRKMRVPGQMIGGVALNLALAVRDAGDDRGAEEIAREAMTILRSSRPTEVVRRSLGQTCYVLGILVMNRDNPSEEAYRLLDEAVTLRRQVFGPETLIYGTTLDMLARSCALTGRKDRAIALTEEALSIARRHPGEKINWLGIAQERLAQLRQP